LGKTANEIATLRLGVSRDGRSQGVSRKRARADAPGHRRRSRTHEEEPPKHAADEKDLEVVGEAANGRQALSLCSRLQPDVILMDVRMPEMDGVAATKEINRGTPHQRHDVDHAQDPDYLLEALKAGRRDTCSRTRPRRR
jgi:CheY-like chemotaxis protein